MIALRPLVPADAPAVRRIYSGASVRFLGRSPMTGREAQEYVCRARELARVEPIEECVLGVHLGVDVGEGAAIGIVKLGRRPGRHGRVSYVLRDDCWGHGYATEAVRELIDLALGATRFWSLGAKHHPDNHASGRVLLRAGFTCLGARRGMIEYHLERRSPPYD
ncbi:GNAT family N-acetyltransferase [Streptomyces sp. NPDC059913]|uniref:GNAT family N-acetyltransferase n=1 Tax=unclassified Streptomyces TaxID=2593676 RepID=UPI003659D84F